MTPITATIYTVLGIGYLSLLWLTSRCEEHYRRDPYRYIPGTSRIHVIVREPVRQPTFTPTALPHTLSRSLQAIRDSLEAGGSGWTHHPGGTPA
jgi:hypothetical protein